MGRSGKRWTVQDRDGNPIYLTHERWKHITGENNHLEMVDYEEHLKMTVEKADDDKNRSTPASIDTITHLMTCLMKLTM